MSGEIKKTEERNILICREAICVSFGSAKKNRPLKTCEYEKRVPDL
jgi:hypothetical protein